MITFKQFLSEQEADDFIKVIERDCAPFMKVAHHHGYLIRGIKNVTSSPSFLANVPWKTEDYDEEKNTQPPIKVYIRDVRKDRQPKNTPGTWHNNIDFWFKHNFGINARTQAVFAFGKDVIPETVKWYGTPHLVFPIGSFRYVWSPEVTDLYADLDDYIQELYNEDEEHESVEDWLSDLGYRTTGLEQALASKCEIMIECDKYYAIPAEHEHGIKKYLGL